MFSCQGKLHFINLNGNFPNKKGEKAYPEKEEDAKPEAAGHTPGEHYGSHIKESLPPPARTAGTPQFPLYYNYESGKHILALHT